MESYSTGKYMVKKYACQPKLFNLSTDDLPDLTIVKGPASLLQRFKTSKGVTIRRANIKTKIVEYLSHVENGIVKRYLNANNFPNMQRIVICEEKYSVTPDDFKTATRQKRQNRSSSTISHLKIGSEMISEHKLSKSAVIQTDLGKRLISNYLARNVKKLNITKDVVLDIDSELFLQNCTKHKIDECSCPYKLHTTPVRAYFSKSGFIRHEMLNHIKQRKVEAEMAQVDWLSDMKENFKENEAVVSIVTSADVDSLIIHLFAFSIHWTRRSDEALEKFLAFKNDLGSMQPISAALNEEVYFEIVKRLYATASIKSEQLSFEAIRQMSIKPPGKQQKHPKFWIPPKSELIKITKLINCQIKYLFTVWTHDAVLPNFLAEGMFEKGHHRKYTI
ncbi:unnamed protein product [Mytilus coruscus]|uniref:Uncharacterized protein n=1 Tax=Mytilus coruscus TaxID=42192 RepID=A0A6J8D3Y6_MYTCO|nr:unnamed protein product [Mytilus coruscus]